MNKNKKTQMNKRFVAALLKVAAITVLVCGNVFLSRAQTRIESATDEFAYDFRVFFQINESELSRDYLENAATLDILDSLVREHGVETVNAVKVIAYSSPEGPYQFNLDLARSRATSMQAYLENRIPELKGKMSIDFGVSPEPKDLRELPRLRYAAFRLSFPYDLSIPIPRLPEDFRIDESLYALSGLNDMNPLIFSEEKLSCTIPAYNLDQRIPNTILAMKSNFLYNLATVYNVEIEVPIADRWSVVVEDVFPWWESINVVCLQMWEVGVEARYWLKPWKNPGTDKLKGFFAGVYGMSAKYDFQWVSSVDYQGEYWSAGLTGGWCTSLGRNKWGNLELSLGLGYLQSPYRHYLPTDSFDKLIRDPYRTGTARYFGPTKAKVSLVIPINVKTRKKEVSHE